MAEVVKKRAEKKKRIADPSMHEELLAKKLFGPLMASESESESDTGGEFDEVQEATYSQDQQSEGSETEVRSKKVWHDEDDDRYVYVPTGKRFKHLRRATDAPDQKITVEEYRNRLKHAFSLSHGVHGTPKWAQKVKIDSKTRRSEEGSDASDNEDVEEAFNEVTTVASKYIGKSELLPKGVINAKRLNDITRGHRLGRRPLTAVQFHPARPVLMTAGENGIITLFEVGLPDTEEQFLQDAEFKNFPITTASFSEDGLKIYAASKRHKYLYSYDLLNGTVVQLRTPREMPNMNVGSFVLSADGSYMAIITRNEVNVVAVSSMTLVGVLTAPAAVLSIQFSPFSSNILYAMTETSMVYMWDIRNAQQQRSFADDGGVRGTVLRVGKNEQFIACGSNTGIVNLYDMSEAFSSPTPKPKKIFDQLTTSIEALVFNSDSQILAFSSSIKTNAIRLAHLRSRTVFSNFPPRPIVVGKVTTCDFSPNSGYLAVGDFSGFLSLFRLEHFEKY